MNILRNLTSKWIQLRLRSQLTLSYISLLIIALLPVLLLFTYLLEPVLLHRGYDLLEISNRRFFNAIFADLQQARAFDKTAEDRVAKIFSDRTGLGATGETYLMDNSGKLLTPSRFTNSPGRSPIPPDLSAQWRGIKKDYRGIAVLAVWRQIHLENETLIVATEIDHSEILAPLNQISMLAIIVVVTIGCMILMILPWLSRALAKNVDIQQGLALMRSRSIAEGQELERESLSSLLHDDIGQQLTGLSLAIASADIPKAAADPLLNQLSVVAKNIQNLSRQVSAIPLQTFGLYPTVETNLNLVRNLAAKKQIDFDFTVEGDRDHFSRLRYDLSLTVFRIVQELSNNMLKHCTGDQAHCSLILTAERLLISISENGSGLTTNEAQLDQIGIGLKSLRARVESFGGRLNIETDRTAGLKIAAIIPLEEQHLN